MIKATIDDRNLRALDAKLSGFRRLTASAAKVALGQSAGRIAVSLAKLTHPRSYEQGRNRISREIAKVVYPKTDEIVKEATAKIPSLKAPLWKAIFEKKNKETKSLFLKAGMDVKLEAKASKERHSRSRVKPSTSGGKTMLVRPLEDRVLLTGSRDTVALLADKIAERQVGHAAAGWLAAGDFFRNLRSSDSVPKYKTNKRTRGQGFGRFDGTPTDLRATLINRVRYLSRPFDSNFVGMAIQFEGEKIMLQIRTLIRKGYVNENEASDIIGI
jgi:hypothetical protein